MLFEIINQNILLNYINGLNYLVGKSLNEINRVASDAALKAHVDGGVPNIVVDLPRLDAYTFGYTVYFFKKACAMSGYLLDVNPFDQPGVEAYKTNMFEMLGKPGYVSEKNYDNEFSYRSFSFSYNFA